MYPFNIQQRDEIVKVIIDAFGDDRIKNEIAKLLNSKDIDKDALNIRRLVIHELGPVKWHRKQVITSEIKNKIKQFLLW